MIFQSIFSSSVYFSNFILFSLQLEIFDRILELTVRMQTIDHPNMYVRIYAWAKPPYFVAFFKIYPLPTVKHVQPPLKGTNQAKRLKCTCW